MVEAYINLWLAKGLWYLEWMTGASEARLWEIERGIRSLERRIQNGNL